MGFQTKKFCQFQSQSWTVAFVTDLLSEAQERAETRPDIDVEHEGLVLVMMVCGMCLSMLAGHVTPETATATIDRELDRVFSKP